MDDFSAKPGVANAFGVVGSDANIVKPGKPALLNEPGFIITRGGDVTLVIGTPEQIAHRHLDLFQVIMNLYDYHLHRWRRAVAICQCTISCCRRHRLLHNQLCAADRQTGGQAVEAMGYTLQTRAGT